MTTGNKEISINDIIENLIENTNESGNKDIYLNCSETYEELTNQLTTEQQRQLEELYGYYNDLVIGESQVAFKKGLFCGIYFLINLNPEIKESINDILLEFLD